MEWQIVYLIRDHIQNVLKKNSYNTATKKTASWLKCGQKDLNSSKEDTQMANKHMERRSTSPIIREMQIKATMRASLVAQWLRICLPMQGTRVWALLREDPTCRRATKPVRHNYWACALEPASHNYWARVPQLLKPTRLEPMLCNKRSHCNEKSARRNEE